MKYKGTCVSDSAGNRNAGSSQSISEIQVLLPEASVPRPRPLTPFVGTHPKMVHALRDVRHMRGGSQPHLMVCSDGFHYVVKFQNNPQHTRTLANEMLGALLARWLGLPIAPFAVVEVGRELFRERGEVTMKAGSSLTQCREGLQFGSRYVCDPLQSTVHTYMTDEDLARIENISDFLGMLVFDKWTCNTDLRQAVFYHESGLTRLWATMIDQGHCFNAEKWDFPDKAFFGFFPRHCVYRSVEGIASFERWLSILEDPLTKSWIEYAAMQIPAEWYQHDAGALSGLVDRLDRRRMCVRKLLGEAKMHFQRPIPNWE